MFVVFSVLTFFAFAMFNLAFSQTNDDVDVNIVSTIIVGLIIMYFLYFVYLFVNNFLLSRAIKQRKIEFRKIAKSKDMQLGTLPMSSTLHSITKEESKQNNVYIKNDWGLYDYEFVLNRRTKYGKSKVKTFYYSVGVFKLSRKLPNIFFDSNKTGGNEFKFLFHKSQKHSLEGDFDSYFSTYFSEEYTIDNLSIISPEVMQALLDAKEYDIEIFEDNLYLYNEIEVMPEQLLDIELKGKNIRDKLNNNIKTYRDERIEVSSGRNTVSLSGLKLRQSLSKYYWRIIGGILLSIVGVVTIIIMAIQGNIVVHTAYFIILGMFIISNNFLKIKKIKSDEQFAKDNKHLGA
jgi:hypothetical protein